MTSRTADMDVHRSYRAEALGCRERANPTLISGGALLMIHQQSICISIGTSGMSVR
jgi:hypothetical protein